MTNPSSSLSPTMTAHLPIVRYGTRLPDALQGHRDHHKQCNNLFRPDKEFMTERNRLLGTYFPNRSATVISQLQDKGWYTTVKVPRLKYNGVLNAIPDTLHQGDVLQISKTYTVYYTLDDSYPILWSSANSAKLNSATHTYTANQNLLDAIDWEADTVTDNRTYDLQGRPADDATSLSPGVYVRHGKKIVVR